MNNLPSHNHIFRWFDPRHRHPGTWAFILNRVTALGLSLYLFLHLFMLSKLAQGPDAYDALIALAKTPFIKMGEILVITAGILHGLNGIRISMTTFGWGIKRQKLIFFVLMVIGLSISGYFGYRMFFGE
jgi:succinate dehydrogenase / fumarate reductase cytochrome b subunit